MKKFLRIIIAIMILPFWLLGVTMISITIMSALPVALIYDGKPEVSLLMCVIGDIWISLYRWVRL